MNSDRQWGAGLTGTWLAWIHFWLSPYLWSTGNFTSIPGPCPYFFLSDCVCCYGHQVTSFLVERLRSQAGWSVCCVTQVSEPPLQSPSKEV